MLPDIEAKIRLATRRIEAVTWEAVLGEDRSDLAVEVNRSRWSCELLGIGPRKGGGEADDSKAEY